MGQGLPVPAPAMTPWARMFDLPAFTGDEQSRTVATHWYLDGYSPPERVEIPWSWLARPFRFRTDRAVTHAAVSKSGGGTAIAHKNADQQIEFTAMLDSGNDVDAPNLAHFMTVYYDEPRTRLNAIRLILNGRSDTECWTILGVGIGDRVELTDVPAGFPRGAAHLVVEGIASEDDGATRSVVWSTSPVIGEKPGEVGPFFRVGVSVLDGPDKIPW